MLAIAVVITGTSIALVSTRFLSSIIINFIPVISEGYDGEKKESNNS